ELRPRLTGGDYEGLYWIEAGSGLARHVSSSRAAEFHATLARHVPSVFTGNRFMHAFVPFALTLAGSLAGDVTLLDSRGQAHDLREWDGAPILVVAFLSVDCPVARFYATRLEEIRRELSSQGVAVIGIA